jgi:AhpD family alkylhydroperoxidase
MLKNLIIACTLMIPTAALADKTDKPTKADKEYEELLTQSPFNKMYPKHLAPAAATYFGAFNSLFAEGAIAPKEARLAAVSASAAIRCEYCITAQVHLAKQAGATEDEIKSAIQIAAEVARFSILLYGNEFGQDELKTILKIED